MAFLKRHGSAAKRGPPPSLIVRHARRSVCIAQQYGEQIRFLQGYTRASLSVLSDFRSERRYKVSNPASFFASFLTRDEVVHFPSVPNDEEEQPAYPDHDQRSVWYRAESLR